MSVDEVLRHALGGVTGTHRSFDDDGYLIEIGARSLPEDDPRRTIDRRTHQAFVRVDAKSAQETKLPSDVETLARVLHAHEPALCAALDRVDRRRTISLDAVRENALAVHHKTVGRWRVASYVLGPRWRYSCARSIPP